MDAGRMETPFDYFFDDRTKPRTLEALRGGPLASPLKAYAQRLHEDGYATHSGFVQLRLLGCFNLLARSQRADQRGCGCGHHRAVSSWQGANRETAQRRFCRAVSAFDYAPAPPV